MPEFSDSGRTFTIKVKLDISFADDHARTALFHRMNDLVRAFAPWIGGEHRYGNELARPWLKGYKPDPLLRYQWKFYDVAPR